ncbi:hypothetical protein IAT38_001988 [Cryptococcus sp. DSM 104549]
MRWCAILLLPLVLAVPSSPKPRNTAPSSFTADNEPASETTAASASSSTVAAEAPVVTIAPGGGDEVKITGIGYPDFKQDVFLGVPFAKPPVNELRFAPPECAVYNSSITAQKQPPACMQDPTNTVAIGPDASISEDCLYHNVYAPQGASQAPGSLPVMVWVYGGAFTSGSAAIFNATALMGYGLQTKRPFVFVALNYRLGAFGWGYGSGFAENGAANLGLKDIKKGLEWVQENIGVFGGDKDQVTVFGESAGAISISLLYLDPEISLFRSAIMESGAQSTSPLGPTDTTWDDAYKYLLIQAGCDGFQCLKGLSAEKLLDAQMGVKNNTAFKAGFVFGPSIDGELIPDSPFGLLLDGKFAKIPFITGNNKDEGTLFTPTTVNSTLYGLGLIDLMEPVDPSNDTLKQVVALYPDDPSLGSPFDTGNNTFGLSSAWKQTAAILGDANFQATRRNFLRQVNQHGMNQTWTYQFEQITPGAEGYLGSYHSSEIPYVYGSAGPGNGECTEEDAELSQKMMDYWLNFAYYTDPNGANATEWPAHNIAQNKNILRLLAGQIEVFQDDYREEQMAFFLDNPKEFNFRRRAGQGTV